MMEEIHLRRWRRSMSGKRWENGQAQLVWRVGGGLGKTLTKINNWIHGDTFDNSLFRHSPRPHLIWSEYSRLSVDLPALGANLAYLSRNSKRNNPRKRRCSYTHAKMCWNWELDEHDSSQLRYCSLSCALSHLRMRISGSLGRSVSVPWTSPPSHCACYPNLLLLNLLTAINYSHSNNGLYLKKPTLWQTQTHSNPRSCFLKNGNYSFVIKGNQ